MTTNSNAIAYHFVGSTLRDGRPIPPDGEWLVHEGPAVMCKTGLHASRHPRDALTYAPGNTLCLVEVEEIESEEDDKLVARRRRIVRRIDATRLLREFAADCAERVWHLAPANSQLACAWAIDAARRFARGECEQDELDAADAATAAAAAAAAAADADAATYAATYAADAADAADAATYAATYAAEAADAERKWQRDEFKRRCDAALKMRERRA